MNFVVKDVVSGEVDVNLEAGNVVSGRWGGFERNRYCFWNSGMDFVHFVEVDAFLRN